MPSAPSKIDGVFGKTFVTLSPVKLQIIGGLFGRKSQSDLTGDFMLLSPIWAFCHKPFRRFADEISLHSIHFATSKGNSGLYMSSGDFPSLVISSLMTSFTLQLSTLCLEIEKKANNFFRRKTLRLFFFGLVNLWRLK